MKHRRMTELEKLHAEGLASYAREAFGRPMAVPPTLYALLEANGVDLKDIEVEPTLEAAAMPGR